MSVVANVAINVDARGAAQELNKVDQAAKGLSGSFGGLRAAVAALGVGLVAKSIADVGTQSEASKIKIKALTAQYGELGQATTAVDRIQKVLGTSAIETRDSYAQLYGSLRGTGLGAEQLEVLFVGLNKAARLSGGGAQEAQAGIMQLKQAFSSGALSGDELRSVLENMPVFAQAVAKETDRLGLTSNATSADLKRLGAEGKLTSTILFDAAKKLATMPAPELTSIEKVNVAFSNLAEKIAEAVGPTVVSLMTKFSAALSVVGRWFAANQGFVQAVVSAFGLLVKYVGPLAVGILAVVKAYQAWQIISKALAATQAFLMALTGPKGLAIVAAAGVAAGTAYAVLNNTLKGTDEELKKQTAEAAKAKAEFAATADGVAPLPSKIQESADKTASLAEGFRQAANEATRGQLAINAQIASLERGASIASARYGAEKAINDLQGQQLERAYGLAQTAQQRLDIAVRIFNNAVNAAKIEHSQALENIALEQRKIELQVQLAQLKSKEIEAEGQLQILKSKDAAEAEEKQRQLDKALAAQNEVVTATQAQSASQQEIAKYQEQTAGAQLESKILAAQTALEQKLTSDQIGLSAQSAATLSNGLAQSAGNANQLAGSMSQVASQANAAANAISRVSAARGASTVTAAPGRDISGRSIQDAIQSSGGVRGGGYAVTSSSRQTSASGQLTGSETRYINADGTVGSSKIQAHFAKGGVVTKPTVAMIGEGGEPEYIVPQSKAEGFAANYLSGARGSSAIPSGGGGSGGGSPTISIQTGPVMQMNGQNYVTTQDLSSAVQAGVQQTLNMMRNDRGTRRAVGLA